MEQISYVSLWVGEFSSTEELENYLLIDYTEDGDAIPSQFEKDFNIEYFDEDFSEAHYEGDEVHKLSQLLEGCSYDDVVIPNFVEKYGENLPINANSMILLYDFEYNKSGDHDKTHPVKYVGSVRYE
ncbi:MULTISPECIES: immunity 22 family protein [Priestia]|uniref:immunity 22 family protein n=1 Tax=Priestia TaxID=2800373 RepID=UPI001C8D5221|nr:MULTISPECIES: immunity 22 family protein [Priestia]MBY0061276.1 immunity 22 family protein [Priestia aryabhattai]MDN3361804.1 immunity 22 family protein [Priestia megaterium]WKU22187.1 immunity 22 family protein [Priestia megaterium]